MLKHVCDMCKPWGLTVLRIVVGVILINHGWGKLFGDTSQALAFFESTVLPAPALMLWVAGVIEVFGGALLILGLFTRVVSFIVSLQFLVIVLFVKLQYGLMAMELDLMILAATFALTSAGHGAMGMDHYLGMRKKGNGNLKGGHGQEAVSGSSNGV